MHHNLCFVWFMFQDYILEQLIDNAEISVIDLETTGMSPLYSRIIEIGIVKIQCLKITNSYKTFVNPGTEIPYQITRLTGIKNEDVCNAPFIDEILPDIQQFLGDSIICGHNLQFDLGFLNTAFRNYGYEKISNPLLCTLKLARKLCPDLSSKSLGSVVDHFGIIHKNVHRALGDATVTAKVLLKMIPLLKEDKKLSTVSDIINYQFVPLTKNYRFIKKKLITDLTRLPDSPGVYFFKDSKGNIIYIGKAKSLKNRVKSYFSSNSLKKTRKIIKLASHIDYEVTGSELSALIAEAELIKVYKPHFNVQLKKFTQTYFIRLNHAHEYPRPEVTKKFDFDGSDYFGPYNNIDTVTSLHVLLNKAFTLRECDDKEFAKHRECYLSQICRCLGPCSAENMKEEYGKELLNVYDFLSGKNQFALNRLINKMKDLAERQKYEEAAQFRDVINLILSQIHKSSILSEPVNTANALIVIRGEKKSDMVLLLSGKLFIRKFFIEREPDFDTALDDFYNGTVSLFHTVDLLDLERIKIALSWLVRNKTATEIYYLKDYLGKKELLQQVSQKHPAKFPADSSEFNLKRRLSYDELEGA